LSWNNEIPENTMRSMTPEDVCRKSDPGSHQQNSRSGRGSCNRVFSVNLALKKRRKHSKETREFIP